MMILIKGGKQTQLDGFLHYCGHMTPDNFLDFCLFLRVEETYALSAEAALLFSSKDFQQPLLFISSVMLMLLWGIFNTLPLNMGTWTWVTNKI